MGEITDALRRAQKEKHLRAQSPSPTPIEDGEAPSERRPSPPLAPEPLAGREPQGQPARAESIVHLSDTAEEPSAARVVLTEQYGRSAERFRQFALRLMQELGARQTRQVLITSAMRADGKTTVSCNLALALASMSAGRRIALIELDLRRPSIANDLSLGRPPVGLERSLTGELPIDAACQRSDSGIDLFLVDKPVENAHEILARREIGNALGELNERYETTIIDTPPVLAVPDVSLILPHVKACVAVVRNQTTPMSGIRAMLNMLPKQKVIGAFLNDASEPRHFGTYDYYSDYHEKPAAD